MTNDEAKKCGDFGGRNSDGEFCGAWAGAGTEFDNGKCKWHRGTNSDGSSHENNQHAVSHGLYADYNNFYQQTLDDTGRRLVDEIFQDYCTEYRRVNGDRIPTGHQSRLFEVSVNHVKTIYADNWLENKPDELQSGNPMVDKDTTLKQVGDQVVRDITYKETTTLAGQLKLRKEDRAFLRDVGLLNDPESQKADAIGQMAVTIQHHRKEDLDESRQ